MSFSYDERTQKRIKKTDRQAKIIAGLFLGLFVILFIGIRLLVIGGFNECFWAQDVGTCLSILNSRP